MKKTFTRKNEEIFIYQMSLPVELMTEEEDRSAEGINILILCSGGDLVSINYHSAPRKVEMWLACRDE